MANVSGNIFGANSAQFKISGYRFLLSFGTIVGVEFPAKSPSNHHIYRRVVTSTTTSRHLNENGFRNAMELTDEHFEEILDQLIIPVVKRP